MMMVIAVIDKIYLYLKDPNKATCQDFIEKYKNVVLNAVII